MLVQARSTPDSRRQGRLLRDDRRRASSTWHPGSSAGSHRPVGHAPRSERLDAIRRSSRGNAGPAPRSRTQVAMIRYLAAPPGAAGSDAARCAGGDLRAALPRARRSCGGNRGRARRPRDHRARPYGAAARRSGARALRPLRGGVAQGRPRAAATSPGDRSSRELAQRFPATLRLAGAAMLIAHHLRTRHRDSRRAASRLVGGSAHHAWCVPRDFLSGVLGGPAADPRGSPCSCAGSRHRATADCSSLCCPRPRSACARWPSWRG